MMTFPLKVVYTKMVYPRTSGVPIAAINNIIPKESEDEAEL